MNLKIFKLRSGEELICQVIEDMKTKVKVTNPLVLSTVTSFDEMGQYDMTVLKDWLSSTDNKIIDIPKNHIALSYDPNNTTTELYNNTLSAEKDVEEKVVKMDQQQEVEDQQLFQNFLNALMGDMAEQMANKSNDFPSMDWPDKPRPRKKAQRRKDISPEMSEKELDRHGIYLTMMIPAEALMNLITSGLLNPEDLLKMIKEVKKRNRFTGDEKTREDFGNKYTDWNSDPKSNDYN